MKTDLVHNFHKTAWLLSIANVGCHFLIVYACAHVVSQTLFPTSKIVVIDLGVGLDQLCWHNFENNRHLKELGIMLE